MSTDERRFAQLLALVGRENEHLQAVRRRLLGDDCRVDAQRLQKLLSDDTGIDRLESFGAKFARMQDTITDKLIPAFLRTAGETVQTAIDNLGRMERLGLLSSADGWLEMRRLRNRLVHEYIDHPADLALALERACRFSERMQADYALIAEYARAHFNIEIDR